MAETTADVRRDIELTRERMSRTIEQLEEKVSVMQIVRDHPWPAIGAAAAAGFLLSGSGADAKSARAVDETVEAGKRTGTLLGPMLDDILGRLLAGVQDVLQQKADEIVDDLRRTLGTPGPGAALHPAPGSDGGAMGAAGHAAGYAAGHAASHVAVPRPVDGTVVAPYDSVIGSPVPRAD